METQPVHLKRPAPRLHARENDIYLSNKHKLVVFYKRAEALLLDPKYGEVALHGLGASMEPCLYLVQDLKSNFRNAISVSIRTTTVQVVDDRLDPNTCELSSAPRNVSGVVVRVVKRSGQPTA
eukprot:GDKI01014674.1.p1 GENE.GDKI01014674.1~~GDKI01014674.1.p1  ORF type:complete len:123 (-),score=22.00 GDKI01014674.1:586-954(-)